MIKSYISENNIQDIEYIDLKKIHEKIKLALNSEMIDEKKPKNLLFSIINFFIFIFSGMMLFSIFSDPCCNDLSKIIDMKIDEKLLIILIFIVFIFTFSKFFTKTIKRNLNNSEIKSRTKRQISNYISQELLNGFKPTHTPLGKILYLTKNKVTDNVFKDYLGDIRIFYPLNNMSDYCLTIENHKKEYAIIKKFQITDISSCKKYQLDYDENLYKIDNSVHEESLSAASNMELKATLAGANGSHLSKSFAQNNARKIRNALHEKNTELEKKRRLETEVLILKFEDGSKFEINHVDDAVLARLQRMIENN